MQALLEALVIWIRMLCEDVGSGLGLTGYIEFVCVCTLLITCSLNIDLAGECGMIVGPHSTKLPQSWDTGSDQPSVPASEDSDRLS